QEHSHHVRHYFIENARRWLNEFHIDALRLDAVHAIYDFSAKPFLSELAEAIEHDRARLRRRTHLIAECDLNGARIILASERNGYQLDAQWSDDFHRAVHTLLTGESTGYYVSFGNIEQLATCFRDGWCY